MESVTLVRGTRVSTGSGAHGIITQLGFDRVSTASRTDTAVSHTREKFYKSNQEFRSDSLPKNLSVVVSVLAHHRLF
jgi:preprotein translocase subunit YajC